MPVSVSKVGHVVLRVRDLERALSFYSGVLGLAEVGRRDFGEGTMAFLSTGNTHHDIALVEVGGQGLYVSDPDGNLIELYVDADEAVWRRDPSQVATSEPLTLDG